MVKEGICPICGEKAPLVKGMCRKCYCKKYNKAHRKTEKTDKRSETTKAIVAEFAATDGISQANLARKYGISRQRVFLILKRAGLR